MKIYGLSGLGADERVFKHLDLGLEIITLPWLDPLKKESIESYANRLLSLIDTSEEFILLGVSFGGLVAVELGKKLDPKMIVLISSAATKYDLRKLYRWIGRIGIVNFIPTFLFDPPRFLMNYLFSAKNTALLSEILDDTNLRFTKWAIGVLTTWNNEEVLGKVIKIHGTKDLLIPCSKSEKTIKIRNGGHFMIVDRAEEISEIIRGKFNIH